MGIVTNHELSKTYQEAMLAAANFTAVSRREIESVKESLRAPVCKNQTKSKFRGKRGKFDFFHILMLDRLGYN